MVWRARKLRARPGKLPFSGEELNALLHTLAAREGLAMLALQETPPAYVPQELRSRRSAKTPRKPK